MQRAQSKSRGKRIYKKFPSTDLLYRCYQRRLSQHQYIKTFPKKKLNLNARNATILNADCNEEYIYQQVLKMKNDNQMLQAINQNLKSKIRKQSKLNSIYEKKMERLDIHELTLEKAFEIKQLLEVQQLEEMLIKKQEQLDNLIKDHKKKKEGICNQPVDPFIELHIILLENSSLVEDKRQATDEQLSKCHRVSENLNEKRHRLKHIYKQKIEQLKDLKMNIKKEEEKLPQANQLVQQNSDAGLFGLHRNKNIQEIDLEINKIKMDYRQFEIKIQQEMDRKIKEKIQIYREIEALSEKIARNKHNNSNN